MNPKTMVELHGQPTDKNRIFGSNFQPLTWMDGYKHSQWLQYPDNLVSLVSYAEARLGAKHMKIPALGIQAFLKEYLTRPVTMGNVEWQKKFNEAYGAPFNYEGWKKVAELGYWPVEIRAVPEGTVMPPNAPMFYIKETSPEFAWLVSPLETALLRAQWYMASVGAISLALREIIEKYLDLTSDVDPKDFIPFAVNDFGARGSTGHEGAMLGGMAHLLVGFSGTDNMEALHGLSIYFHDELAKSGFTIPASEHSTATSFGSSPEDEACFNSHMIKAFGSYPMFASVIDSFDPRRNISDNWLGRNGGEVAAMDAILVLRPDSGIPEEEAVATIKIIAEKLGAKPNTKGYLVLPQKVRVIYGDGISEESLPRILQAVKEAGFSTENLSFGIGGALLQSVTRDTERWAMKACQIDTGDGPRPIGKNPVTDPSKKSKFGVYSIYRVPLGFFSEGATFWFRLTQYGPETCNGITHSAMGSDILVISDKPLDYLEKFELMTTRFRNGLLLEDYDVETVRNNVETTR